MQRHEGDLRSFVISVGIAYQRGVIQELVKGLSPITRIHGRVDQFAQIFYSRVGLGSVFLLEQLDVAGTVNERFQNVGSARNGGSVASCSAGILPAVVEASRLHIFAS